jgi:fatty acid desaturase
MEQEFYKSNKLNKEKMHQLLPKRNHPASIRFLIMFTLFLATATMVVLCWEQSWWKFALALFGFGIMGCSLFACQHESIHNTAFKSMRLNRIAAFVCGVGHLYAPTAFRELHFTHHRHTHEPGKDPEISLGAKPLPSVVATLPAYMGWISGFPLLMFKLMMLLFGALGMPEIIRKRWFPFVRNAVKNQIAFESAFTLCVHAGIAAMAILFYPGFWGLFIGQAVSHCLLASYLIMEHSGLPHKGTVLEKTRSIKTNSFINLLMWNMPYHAEHHAYPGVPFHALPKLHKEIFNELAHKEEGHIDFHLKVIQSKI